MPGLKGAGVGTLLQSCARPELLQLLTVDDEHPYDVAADQAAKAEVLLVPGLSQMAQRMEYLEAQLAGFNRVVLGSDPAKLLVKFREALPDRKTPIRFWSAALLANSPVARMRRFYPPDEGGIDASGRKLRFEFSLVPFRTLPPPLNNFQTNVEPGRYLWGRFSKQFTDFLLGPKMPRDLLLRGNFDEATTALVTARESYQQYKSNLQDDPDFPRKITEWATAANRAFANLYGAQEATLRARRRSPCIGSCAIAGKGSGQSWGKIGLHIGRRRLRRSPVEGSNLFPGDVQARTSRATSNPSRSTWARAPEEMRKRSRRLGRSGGWWESFIADSGPAPITAAARCNRACALEKLNQKDAALALFQDTSGVKKGSWQEAGQLYRLKLLKK